ncbi:MAG: NAD(P)-dependent alcohol dehydrogenase [Rhodospirillales bacterium]|nr:NAD(P)-dependent alcohol dehydrogenase [Rhodospirillales bacterium]
MRVFQVEGGWSRANLRLAERPEPEPGPGEVRLKMHAAALNYRDLLVPEKGYGARMKALPLIMLSDGVGTVDKLGPGVTGPAVGTRVCPLMNQSWLAGEPDDDKLALTLGSELDGTMADYMVVAAAGVVPVPEHLSDAEAATLPTAAITAWRALISEGRLRPGERVLVQGTGGVSLFALLFAKLAGAFVIVISSSDEKLERVRGLGADATLNYRETPEWGRPVRALAGGGVDHVVEVGGQGTLPQSLRAVGGGGTISLIGVLAGGTMDARLGLIVTRHVRLQGITVGSGDDFRAMVRAIGHSRLNPPIDSEFAFENLHAALDHLASGRHFGKIVIRF